MPTPTIPDGKLFMNATTYTGNGTSQTITNGAPGQSFQPDLVWGKNRSNIANHGLVDSVRGISTWLGSNSTAAENTVADSYVTAFNSNGFTAGLGGVFNASGDNYVAWQWKAGGAAVTNTAGSISAQVSANTTSGFSVVTYTGTGSVATIGHGLGVAPKMIFFKVRSNGTYGWYVYNSVINATNHLVLNTTAASSSSSFLFNDTEPTSTVMSVGTSPGTNQSGQTYVAYCWSQIAGYSAFGSYTGNGSADGPFIYLGFRPRFVMVKGSSYGSNWNILDAARDPYNLESNLLRPNSSAAEASTPSGSFAICWDALSNGFKLRGGSGTNDVNQDGQTLIYAAFAENPFKYANAR